MTHWHFSGIGGAGMNPLARLMAARGDTVQGSDRGFDQGHNLAVQQLLRDAGVQLLAQDGSAISPRIDRFIHSAAVEDDTPEMLAVAQHGIACTVRPALLAEVVNAGQPGIAIAGTSGKSTVVGMIAWILQRCQLPATVLGGAALAEAGANHMGCFAAGPLDGPVLAEACESDGTLVGYTPKLGLIHNISRDHDEIEGLLAQFATFAEQSETLFIDADDAACVRIAATHDRVVRYGFQADADVQLEVIRSGPWQAYGVIHAVDQDVDLELPHPGVHNLKNALAAVCIAQSLGVPLAQACAALADFPGVARRFQVLGSSADGITVVDDYGHNGAKIAATIAAAQEGCDRLLAVFMPHGFAPARFLCHELSELLPQVLRPTDLFCYGPIYYAGGTVAKDISSDIMAAAMATKRQCASADSHEAVLEWIAQHAMPKDCVVIMGARDPQLPALAQAVLDLM